MKLVMIEWVKGLKNLPAWWKHNEDADLTAVQIFEAFKSGNNVMLYHAKGEDFICLDSGKFGQR